VPEETCDHANVTYYYRAILVLSPDRIVRCDDCGAMQHQPPANDGLHHLTEEGWARANTP
jgi:hypothetical protein